jgi:nitrogen regulatory protein PII
MYALFLILNDPYKLHDIHEIFYNHGVGATTMDSHGMGKVLLEHNVDIPILRSVRKLLEGDQPYNKTMVSVIKDENVLNKVVDDIKVELDGLDKAGAGFMFVVPVQCCYGFKTKEK